MKNENLTTNVECDITGNINVKNNEKILNDTTKIIGIYKIINKVDGKYYVGSSNDVLGKFGRWYEHKKKLKQGIHHNIRLQRAWNKHGENNFSFNLIEECEKSKLLSVEQIYLNDSKDKRNICYNLSFVAGRADLSEQTKLKISKKMKNYCASPEVRRNMSIRMSGDQNSFYGKLHTEETKLLISERCMGRKPSNTKSVKQIDLKTNALLKVWPSASSAFFSIQHTNFEFGLFYQPLI